MAKTRRNNRKKKASSSHTTSKSKSKNSENVSHASSDTSPFKGFDDTENVQPTDKIASNSLGKFDYSSDDKDELFDKLLNDGFKHHFNKNIKTYYNKKKEQTSNSPLLEFSDCRNRDDIIKWLNDNRNVFDRLTQTQTESVSEECESQFDLPSVSQQCKSKRSNTRPSRYKLRAKSLDIQIKKNVCSGRNKRRHSSADNSPDNGDYSIQEVDIIEEIPISAKKDAIDMIDLIEDEYLDNIEREIMQQEEKKLSGWERIKDFNKSVAIKKPKPLKVKVEESPKKDVFNNNRTYDYDVLENYFIETMQKLIDNKNDDINNSNTDMVLFTNTLHVGRNFLTMLKKIKESNGVDLVEFQNLFMEIQEVLGGTKQDFGMQTQIEYSDKSVQVASNFNSVQTQTVRKSINSSTQTSCNVTKFHKFTQTFADQKISVCVQTEEIVEAKNEDAFEDDLDFDFNSEELIKLKVETEKHQNIQSKESVLLVSEKTDSESKGTKRTMLESPEPIRKTSKRPCSDFIIDDLSVAFSTCGEDDQKKNIMQWSEKSDSSLCDKYLNKVLDKSDNTKVPQKTKTQEQIEELENMIDEAIKPKPKDENLYELDDDIECFNEFTEHRKTPEISTPNKIVESRPKIEYDKKSSRKSLFEENLDDIFSNSIFTNESVMEDQTIVAENRKITVLENIIVKPGAEKASDYGEDDFVESTPQNNLSKEESQLDVTLPPPLEFQDNEKKHLVTTPRRPLAVINKITSTPVSQKPESEKFLTLSPISFNESQKNSKNSFNRENKRPGGVYELSKFSPLTIIKNTQDRFSSSPKQKTILNYIKPSQESDSQNSFISNGGKPCIACSRITKDQVIAISSLTNKKLATYSASFTSKVTHLIVSVNERNCLKDHTIKYISAVASGIWVLNFNWIQECLKNNKLVLEEPFEVLDVSGNPGPRNSRLLRVQEPLFKGFTIYPAPPFVSTTQHEIENVIRLLGGKVAPSPEYLLDRHGNFCVIVTEARATHDFELYETWLDALKVITVDIEWLSRSVGQYQLLSLRPFALCSDDNIESLGYPSKLTVNMTYSFSQQTFSTVPSST